MRLVSAMWADFYPFDNMLPEAQGNIGTKNPDDLREGDILIVWGGGDISPSLYGKKVSHFTGAGEKPGYRDIIEWALMKKAQELGIPILGVCRGAQLLCALAGGYLIQHVNNHAGRGHLIQTKDGGLMPVNSIHHQMCIPFDTDHELLGWANERLSDIYIDEDSTVDIDVEPELVYYPKLKGLGIQWHPEALQLDTTSQHYINSIIHRRIL